MRCPVTGCGASIKTMGHTTCPYHAPCHQDGTYDPSRCASCKAHMESLLDTPEGDTSSLAWKTLDSVVRHLRHAVQRAPHLPDLTVHDQRIRDWFPRAVYGSRAYQETNIPRTPGKDIPDFTPPRETPQGPTAPGPEVMNRLTALEQTVLKLSDLPNQVKQILSAVNPAPDSAARRSRSVSLSSSSSSRLPSR